MTEYLRYRPPTGPDDKSFRERVSAALDEGYVLYGSPRGPPSTASAASSHRRSFLI